MRKDPKITVGKLHVLLPPHLQGKRARTWCGRYTSDVSWVFAPSKKILVLARRDICTKCRKAIAASRVGNRLPSHARL